MLNLITDILDIIFLTVCIIVTLGGIACSIGLVVDTIKTKRSRRGKKPWVFILRDYWLVKGLGKRYGYRVVWIPEEISDPSRASSYFCNKVNATSEILGVYPGSEWIGDVDN